MNKTLSTDCFQYLIDIELYIYYLVVEGGLHLLFSMSHHEPHSKSLGYIYYIMSSICMCISSLDDVLDIFQNEPIDGSVINLPEVAAMRGVQVDNRGPSQVVVSRS